MSLSELQHVNTLLKLDQMTLPPVVELTLRIVQVSCQPADMQSTQQCQRHAHNWADKSSQQYTLCPNWSDTKIQTRLNTT